MFKCPSARVLLSGVIIGLLLLQVVYCCNILKCGCDKNNKLAVAGFSDFTQEIWQLN